MQGLPIGDIFKCTFANIYTYIWGMQLSSRVLAWHAWALSSSPTTTKQEKKFLTRNSLHSPGWPQTYDSSASVSWELGIQAYATTPRLKHRYFYSMLPSIHAWPLFTKINSNRNMVLPDYCKLSWLLNQLLLPQKGSEQDKDQILSRT